MAKSGGIDVLETSLRDQDDLLAMLLSDRTTKRNILWATDSYTELYGAFFAPNKQILADLITGQNYGKIIQPRAVKSQAEQYFRTKEKGEVFTPLSTIKKMNNHIDKISSNPKINDDNWRQYVKELRLEIACGEGPFIASRYNPTANTEKIIDIKKRVGFLDRKLQVVSRYCKSRANWVVWAKEAFMASYGYEWQGDNVLIARENLLYTMADYYQEQFGRAPSLKLEREFAEIISWNIFQMDGVKYVVPMSCRHQTQSSPNNLVFPWVKASKDSRDYCKGCKYNQPTKHNGKYVYVMDWRTNKKRRFIDIIEAN